LESLRASDSLATFYGCVFPDDNGDLRTARDVAATCRALRKEQIDLYVDYVNMVIERLVTGPHAEDQDRDRHGAVLSIALADAEVARLRGSRCLDLNRIAETASFFYAGYLVERARLYRDRPGKRIEVNDLLDGLICRHLGVEDDTTL